MPLYSEISKCYQLNLEQDLLRPELNQMILKYW